VADDWVRRVESAAQAFSRKHKAVYSRTDRQLFAAFEIGCFLALVRLYEEKGHVCVPRNLTVTGEYRYPTSPNGNPANFSYVQLIGIDHISFEMRQQVRVRSHLDTDIAFTPDILVIRTNSSLGGTTDPDFASGKRRFFCVDASDVVAAHECKSLNPFPELLVSFLGMLVAAHSWLGGPSDRTMIVKDGAHLAPTLFVGGTARSLHLRMVRALCKTYPINVILGMHSGTWDLFEEDVEMAFIDAPKIQSRLSDSVP
jgi:hypothetical protein